MKRRNVILCLYFSFLRLISSEKREEVTHFVCANETTCNQNCEKIVQKFKDDFSHGWAIRHPSIGQHYNKLHCEVCVEIGIARGELTGYLLRHVPNIKEYHGVDPFLGGYDDSNDAMSLELSKTNSSSAWADAINYSLKEFGCKFKLHKGFSIDMVNHFPNKSVDCIFVDGDHTYAGAKSDIDLWYPKLKIGGSFFFDDVSNSFLGVVKAVDEFADSHNFTLHQMNKHNNYYLTIEQK